TTWHVRNAERSHSSDPIRPQQCHIPGHNGSPIMPHYHCLLLAKHVYEANEITNQMQLSVLLDLAGTLSLPIAALVGSNGVVARLRQGGQLVAPGVPGFGKAMQKQDQG